MLRHGDLPSQPASPRHSPSSSQNQSRLPESECCSVSLRVHRSSFHPSPHPQIFACLPCPISSASHSQSLLTQSLPQSANSLSLPRPCEPAAPPWASGPWMSPSLCSAVPLGTLVPPPSIGPQVPLSLSAKAPSCRRLHHGISLCLLFLVPVHPKLHVLLRSFLPLSSGGPLSITVEGRAFRKGKLLSRSHSV